MRLVRGDEIWEIHHEGTQVRIGRTLRRYVSADRAREAYEQQIADRRARGFVEAPDLLTDLDARLVHADDLQQRGDPLGELIAIQSALATAVAGAKKKLERRMAKLLDEQHAVIFGPLAPHAARFGVASKTPPAVEVTWRNGFAERIRIQRAPRIDLQRVYVELRKLPIAAYLRELVVGEPALVSDVHADTYAFLLATMAKEGVPAHLRSLELGDVGPERRARIAIGDIRPVVAACSELEELRIAGKTGIVGPVDAPRLHTLAIDGLGSAAAALVGSPLPALAELIVQHNERTMLDRLIDSGVVRRLRRLTLAHCGLQDSDLQLILDEAEQFSHLELLELRGNTFGKPIVDRAKARLPFIRAIARQP